MKPHTIYATTVLLAILAALWGVRLAMEPLGVSPAPSPVVVLIPSRMMCSDGRVG